MSEDPIVTREMSTYVGFEIGNSMLMIRLHRDSFLFGACWVAGSFFVHVGPFSFGAVRL